MNDSATYFITWTTYGTWLPGDLRGWRKTQKGNQPPQPLLADWCQQRLSEEPVVLNADQRKRVDDVCREHSGIRGWILHAINVRSNHVHLAVTADKGPHAVRDQFKANATRVLRQLPDAITNEKVWNRGGDCTVIDSDEGLRRVIEYIMEEQDQK